MESSLEIRVQEWCLESLHTILLETMPCCTPKSRQSPSETERIEFWSFQSRNLSPLVLTLKVCDLCDRAG